MQQQHRILETISKPASLARLAALLAGESFPHRTAIAQRVCTAFGFHDARGAPQLSTSLKALRTLHAHGSIVLPRPCIPAVAAPPASSGTPSPRPGAVPARVNEVRGLRPQLVRPAVRCRNLASKALALCLRHLAADFRDRYRYAPLLVETFVERDRYDGTCFKAANWIPVLKVKLSDWNDTVLVHFGLLSERVGQPIKAEFGGALALA